MTPLDWLLTLSEALDRREQSVSESHAWYSGDHPIPDPPPNTPATSDAEARQAFNEMARLAVTNFLPPIVDLPAAKLRPEGFRSSARTGTDAELWDIYRRNHLHADVPLGIHEAIKTGQAFINVWMGDDGRAQITVEGAMGTIVAYAAGSRRTRVAALRRWVADDGFVEANVYLPDGIYKFRSLHKYDPLLSAQGNRWERREVAGQPWPVPNPLGVVPVIEMRVNAGLTASRFGGGVPQFAKQLTTQRRINRTVMNRLVTEENQSFRQRWVTGWDYPVDEQGRPDKAALQRASAARLWAFPPTGDEFGGGQPIQVGEFSQADFRPFLDSVLHDVKHIASTSGTPPYAYLLGDMINVAADSLARIEGVQLSIVQSLASQVEEAIVEAMRIGLRMEGDDRADDPALSLIWGEFEQRTATEQANLAQIMRNLGAPNEVVWATLPGVDQAEARRWRTQAAGSALIAAAVAQTANGG